MIKKFKLFLSFILLLSIPCFIDGRVIDIKEPEGAACVIQDIDGIMNITLRVRLMGVQGYDMLAKNYTGSVSKAEQIEKFNKIIGTDVGVFRHIQYNVLKPEFKRLLIETAFPKDKYVKDGWHHKVTYVRKFSGYETLFRIAFWFTGSGFNSSELMKFNKIKEDIRKDQNIIIPDYLLLDIFKGELKIESQVEKNEEQVSYNSTKNGELEYKKDREGEYAAYSLKQGEALYTSVVIRFTGQIRHDDVMKTAEEIRIRSGIEDVTDIAIGYEIKIPISILLPEYLPRDNIRRMEYEKHQAYIDGVKNPVKTKNLYGVHVILDPGHGGADPGAIGYYNMHEDEYAYDVACRIREILSKKTRAKVHMTITDKKNKFSVKDEKKLKNDNNEVLNTIPPYNLDNSRTAANLRCYLINHIFCNLVGEGVDPQKIVFTSFHFDARFSDSRGVMIYIPGSKMRKSSFHKSGGCYKKYYEYRYSPKIIFPAKDMGIFEGYSNEFAYTLVNYFKNSDVEVSKIKPVRDKIFRGRKILLPAVLRYNLVPTSVLIEVANFKNRRDCKVVRQASYRQAVAEAYVNALKEYYDGKM